MMDQEGPTAHPGGEGQEEEHQGRVQLQQGKKCTLKEAELRPKGQERVQLQQGMEKALGEAATLTKDQGRVHLQQNLMRDGRRRIEEKVEGEDEKRGKKRKNKKSHTRTRETRREIKAQTNKEEKKAPQEDIERTQKENARRGERKKEDKKRRSRQTSILDYANHRVPKREGWEGSTRFSTTEKASSQEQGGGTNQREPWEISNSSRNWRQNLGTAGRGRKAGT